MPKNVLSRAHQTGIFVCISELRKAMFLHSEKKYLVVETTQTIRRDESVSSFLTAHREKSLPKIIKLLTKLFSQTAISILVISNHNSFRVPFDKIASVYFI